MKAWVLHNIGDLRYETIPAPKLKKNEALVKVQCGGICSSDVPRVFVTGAYHYPIIPGHELTGTVIDVYDKGRDAKWIGKHVGVFPLLPCFQCAPCQRGEYEICCGYGYIGSRQDGAFAEYVAVSVWNLIELPTTTSFETAAMLEPAAVALHAVKRLNLAVINSVAVIGSGVIGRLIAKWLTIYNVDNVQLIGRGDALPQDVDACIEAVGTLDALKISIKSTRPGGQIVLVGNPPADVKIEQEVYWQILRKQLTVKGSWNSRFPEDWQETIKAMSDCSLQISELVTHRYKLSELGQALEMMRSKQEFRLKVVFNIF